MTTPYMAARNGFPGDERAVNQAGQVNQFLISHGVVPLWEGDRQWTAGTEGGIGYTGGLSWISGGPGWLPEYDADQPFTLPSGVTAVGRAEIAVQAGGNGADLEVILCPDNGSGAPLLTSPLASAVIPASHILAASAGGSLASAGPLATAQGNSVFITGSPSTFPWAQPAATVNGAPDFATPVTSGNFTLFIGGVDVTAVEAVGTVSAVQYLGSAGVTIAVPQSPLPQPAWFVAAAATSDAVVAAGGTNQASAALKNVWTASWEPSSGTLGAWSAQQALPAGCINGVMAAWNTTVYVIGGTTATGDSNATANVWYATEQSGQITSWTAGPPLPQATVSPFAAVVGSWLIVAGGQNSGSNGVANTWYSAINADGSLAGWQEGPALPQIAWPPSTGWDTAVTDSAMIIINGNSPGSVTSGYLETLAVGPSGPAPEWQIQPSSLAAGDSGAGQAGAYPSGLGGSWAVVVFAPSEYTVATASPVAMISVPLPASGLTAGTTYHLVARQLGGNTVSRFIQLGALATESAAEAKTASRYGATWTTLAGQCLAVNVFDQTPGTGIPLHLYQDSGAAITTTVATPSAGLLGVMETVAKPQPPLNSNPTFTSGTAPWDASGGTLTQSSAKTQGGLPYSGLLTAAGGGQAYALTEQDPCDQLAWYVISGVFLVPVAYSAFAVNLLWYDAVDYLGTSNSPVVALAANTWTPVQFTAQAPAGATTFAGAPTLTGSPAAGTLLYLSDVTLTAAAPGQIATVSQIDYDPTGMFPLGVTVLA